MLLLLPPRNWRHRADGARPKTHMATQICVICVQLWQLSLGSVRRSLGEAGLTSLLGPGEVEDGDEEE